ncbi:hypothetical protein CFB52_006610 [Burkholderia sp. AU18528]|nr:hypothetical protein CFB52_006610 [Burkholderia sp. AU18528]
MTQAPSRAGEIPYARRRPTAARAPRAAPTKGANRGDATRVERCARFDASRVTTGMRDSSDDVV